LRQPTGQVQGKPLDQVIGECRDRFGGVADQVLGEWTRLGATLHPTDS
jgi:hypothetical protein